MSSKYYPWSEHICHHVFNNGGCTFCGFHHMKNCVSKTPVLIKEQIKHFENFINNEKNRLDILKRGALSVNVEGSWFVEVPKPVRQRIYDFAESHNLDLHSQCRANLINEEKTWNALAIMMKAKHGPNFNKTLLNKTVQETLEALDTELRPYITISVGLEVANNSDLKLINKGCQLNDYVAFSKFIPSHNAKLGAFVLIAPPLVQDPVRKALQTAQYASDVLQASKIVILSCIPRIETIGHKLWRQGKWNPISATESSEIFQIIKAKYPDKKIRLDTMQVHFLHGVYGPKIKTDAQKIAVRKRVRKIAKEVFSERLGN